MSPIALCVLTSILAPMAGDRIAHPDSYQRGSIPPIAMPFGNPPFANPIPRGTPFPLPIPKLPTREKEAIKEALKQPQKP